MEEPQSLEQYPRRKQIVELPRLSEDVNSGNTRMRRFRDDATAGETEVEPRRDMTCSGRERLERHREEVAGRVTIPEKWGQEGFLVDWIEYKDFDALLAPNGIDSAREALVAEGMRIEGRCGGRNWMCS